MDRRALLVGNWQSEDQRGPSHQRVRALLDRWVNLISTDSRYPFFSLSDRTAFPKPLLNPKYGELVALVHDDASDVTADTELLFYYVGHSVVDGHDDIRLSLNLNKHGQTQTQTLGTLLKLFIDSGIRNAVILLDTCHSGRVQNLINQFDGNIFAMVATGDGYAFNAEFSDRLLRTLERRPQRGDQRMDRRKGGMTYHKVFQVTIAQLGQAGEQEKYKQDPRCFGNMGDNVLVEAPPSVPDRYNEFAAQRSIYGRLFFLMEIIDESNPAGGELLAKIRSSRPFLIRDDGEGRRDFVSRERIDEYLSFMRRAGWLVAPAGRMELTERGKLAASMENFNRVLLEDIDARVLSEGVSIEYLERIIKELLDDMIQPTPQKIRERALMKGIELPLDEALRFAIQVLPGTGRFSKGAADALFPPELNFAA